MDLPPSQFPFKIANGELKIYSPKQILSFDREYDLAVKSYFLIWWETGYQTIRGFHRRNLTTLFNSYDGYWMSEKLERKMIEQIS